MRGWVITSSGRSRKDHLHFLIPPPNPPLRVSTEQLARTSSITSTLDGITYQKESNSCFRTSKKGCAKNEALPLIPADEMATSHVGSPLWQCVWKRGSIPPNPPPPSSFPCLEEVSAVIKQGRIKLGLTPLHPLSFHFPLVEEVFSSRFPWGKFNYTFFSLSLLSSTS